MTFMIYMLGVIDNIIDTFCIVLIFSLIISVVSSFAFLISNADGHKDTAKTALKYLKSSILVLFLSTIICILTPSSKTLAAMYLIPKITDNATAIASHEKINQIPDKVLTLLNGKLDQWINDVTKIKEKR